MTVGTVSVKAETTDMSETNSRLSAIETTLNTLTDYVNTNKEFVREIIDYIHGEVGLDFRMNEIQNKIVEQTEIIDSLNTTTVSANSILENMKQKTDDTVTVLLDIEESNDSIASTLTSLSSSVEETNAHLAILSEKAELDINNQQLLAGLNASISDLNENIDKINIFLGYLYAFCIFAVIALITVVIFRILWNTLIKNMFTGS